MKLLFITRAFPPQGGGMEKFAGDFYQNYREIGNIDLLANDGGKKAYPIFLIKIFFRLLVKARSYDVIHVYDAVLAPIIPLIRLFPKPKLPLPSTVWILFTPGLGIRNLFPRF